ncbi:hypothetical protein [Clostridium tagluense]|uniref:HTH cro/C1-type domain-containing protein n=1 Tax=Clostridium tagluense TaxID=360422 RepID=A0A401UPG1_9CLOT|nr:hypothetical protein [Clostridium tagluense]GCD11407.1 hypothetical protein Ctaglu_30300 [Clostridium tagluense]
MTNKLVREELIVLMAKLGIKQCFIARKFSLSNTTISYFLRNMRDLPTDKLNRIHNFCIDNN